MKMQTFTSAAILFCVINSNCISICMHTGILFALEFVTVAYCAYTRPACLAAPRPSNCCYRGVWHEI